MSSPTLMLERPLSADDRMLGRRILETLGRHYPGWAWTVEMFPGSGVVVIRNLDMGIFGKHRHWGFVLHKRNLYSDAALKSVMRAGGELLERYNRARSRFEPERDLTFEALFASPDAS